MTEQDPMMGSVGQDRYIRSLAAKLGHTDLDAMFRELGVQRPVSVQDASAVVTLLMDLTGTPQKSDAGAPPKKGRGAFASMVLAAVDSGKAIRVDMTPDEHEVYRRLMLLSSVQRELHPAPQWIGKNAGGPIEIQDLIEFFGTVEKLALAFGVSVGTVKGWGEHLPASQAYRAQVVTRGYVCAPR